MLNIIKADIYRILRAPGLYVTFAVLAAFAALASFAYLSIRIFAEPAAGYAQIANAVDGRAYMIQGASDILPLISSDVSMLSFIILSLTLVVTAPMFSSGAVKNGLSTGLCRTKLYASKLILSTILALVSFVVFILICVGIVAAVRGFGTPADGAVAGFMANTAAQFTVLICFVFITVFFTFVTKRTGAVIGILIAVYMVPNMVISLLSFRFNYVYRLLDFELVSILGQFANLQQLDTQQTVRGFVTVAAVVVLSAVCGILLFRKAEIK